MTREASTASASNVRRRATIREVRPKAAAPGGDAPVGPLEELELERLAALRLAPGPLRVRVLSAEKLREGGAEPNAFVSLTFNSKKWRTQPVRCECGRVPGARHLARLLTVCSWQVTQARLG